MWVAQPEFSCRQLDSSVCACNHHILLSDSRSSHINLNYNPLLARSQRAWSSLRLCLSVSLSLPLFLSLLPPQPCEDTAWGQTSASQKECSRQKLNQPAPCSWTSQPPKLQETNGCCLSHSVHGILLWQTQPTTLFFSGTWQLQFHLNWFSQHHGT